MQVIDNRAVLIRTRSPEKYTVIPRSKVLVEDDDGGYIVAVALGLDEMRVLRNLGVKKAPSPIEYKYDWPGRYKPRYTRSQQRRSSRCIARRSASTSRAP
jgi:hypothetical protein